MHIFRFSKNPQKKKLISELQPLLIGIDKGMERVPGFGIGVGASGWHVPRDRRRRRRIEVSEWIHWWIPWGRQTINSLSAVPMYGRFCFSSWIGSCRTRVTELTVFFFFLSLFSFIFAILQIPVSNTRLLIKGIFLHRSFFILKYI